VKNRQAPVTEFGTVKGKPPYMSPEQIKNEPIDRKSDVFSLAVVLWELLTGKSLFEGDSIYAIARAVEHQDIKPPSEALGHALPPGLDAAVMDALIRDPTYRTPTAAAFAEQLEQVINAAADETLESWADRELREPREAHRHWLAKVVVGRDAAKPIGRATGSVTELAPVGKLATLPAAVVTPMTPPSKDDLQPGQSTHLPASSEDSFPGLPRRRLAIPLLALLLIALAIATAVYLVKRNATVSVAVDAPPPPIDARIVVPQPADAAPDAPPDAAPDAPPDAAVHTVRNSHDAGPRPPLRDAAPADTGSLLVPHPGDYLNIILDGDFIGPTPMMTPRALPAGRHTIKLVHPQTHEVVLSRTVTVHDGETVTIE
jgi:hypothetical protein